MGRSSAMKRSAKSNALHEPVSNVCHDHLSSLPMEILEMIVANVNSNTWDLH